MIYILDTDVLSLLERSDSESLLLEMRLDRLRGAQIVTTIISYEEQMRGWLAVAARATTTDQILAAYERLSVHVDTFTGIPILRFDAIAALEFDKLRNAHLRVGTMDLKIAAIALANHATLISRNTTDFGKISNLSVEDWSQ